MGLLQLRTNQDNTRRKRNRSQCVNRVVFCEEGLSVETVHGEVDEHGFGGGHESPAEIDSEVKAAVSLALCVQFGHGEEG